MYNNNKLNATKPSLSLKSYFTQRNSDPTTMNIFDLSASDTR